MKQTQCSSYDLRLANANDYSFSQIQLMIEERYSQKISALQAFESAWRTYLTKGALVNLSCILQFDFNNASNSRQFKFYFEIMSVNLLLKLLQNEALIKNGLLISEEFRVLNIILTNAEIEQLMMKSKQIIDKQNENRKSFKNSRHTMIHRLVNYLIGRSEINEMKSEEKVQEEKLPEIKLVQQIFNYVCSTEREDLIAKELYVELVKQLWLMKLIQHSNDWVKGKIICEIIAQAFYSRFYHQRISDKDSIAQEAIQSEILFDSIQTQRILQIIISRICFQSTHSTGIGHRLSYIFKIFVTLSKLFSNALMGKKIKKLNYEIFLNDIISAIENQGKEKSNSCLILIAFIISFACQPNNFICLMAQKLSQQFKINYIQLINNHEHIFYETLRLINQELLMKQKQKMSEQMVQSLYTFRMVMVQHSAFLILSLNQLVDMNIQKYRVKDIQHHSLAHILELKDQIIYSKLSDQPYRLSKEILAYYLRESKVNITLGKAHIKNRKVTPRKTTHTDIIDPLHFLLISKKYWEDQFLSNLLSMCLWICIEMYLKHIKYFLEAKTPLRNLVSEKQLKDYVSKQIITITMFLLTLPFNTKMLEYYPIQQDIFKDLLAIEIFPLVLLENKYIIENLNPNNKYIKQEINHRFIKQENKMIDENQAQRQIKLERQIPWSNLLLSKQNILNFIIFPSGIDLCIRICELFQKNLERQFNDVFIFGLSVELQKLGINITNLLNMISIGQDIEVTIEKERYRGVLSQNIKHSMIKLLSFYANGEGISEKNTIYSRKMIKIITLL